MPKEAKEPILGGGNARISKDLQWEAREAEKAEEAKLRILKEMNDQKTSFFDRFFQFMEKSKNN